MILMLPPINKRIYHVFIRVWNSPTFTTWASFATRLLSLTLVLPLILNRFNTADIALWYLFSIIISLQSLADMGFGTTFTRVIAFAMGGATELNDLRTIPKFHTEIKNTPNWAIIEKIVSTMQTVYSRLSIVIFFLLVTLGTLSLIKPISKTDHLFNSWLTWCIIIVVTTISFWKTIYAVYLQGINQIALLRRWQAIFSIGAIFTSFIVLFFNGNLLFLVAANQIWVLINLIRNRYFCFKVESGKYKNFKKVGIDNTILGAVWPSAWRSGIGVIMSAGVIQASGLIYAQIGNVANVASYLIALRIIDTIRGFSQAPFYSKIPLLSRLRAQGKVAKQIEIAKRGMIFAFWVFITGFIAVGLTAEPLLTYIKSNATFVSPLMWALLGMGYFLERYGAMHIQLYSTTNHIIWHIANGISGLIYLATSLFLLKYIEVYAFPVGIILGYIGFYTWYSAMYSYKTFQLKFWRFEKSVMLPPFSIIVLYFIYILMN
jgi:hypothetical protein